MSDTENHRGWVDPLRILVSVGLVITAFVLGNRLVDQLHEEPVDVLDVGTTRPMAATVYGQEHTVRLPQWDVIVNVATPARTLAHELFDDATGESQNDVRAPDGGSLVPVTWHLAPSKAAGFENSEPIDLRLVSDTDSIELASLRPGRMAPEEFLVEHQVVAALDGDLHLDDLRIEVDYDGITQVLHVEAGDIDADRAQPLYETDRFLLTGCGKVEDGCHWTATSATNGIEPLLGAFIVEPVTLTAWDEELGWAKQGSLWATMQLRAYAPHAGTTSGDVVPSRKLSAPKITLEGERPARRAGLTGGDSSSTGTVVFAVPVDQAPGRLVVRTVMTLDDGQKMPLRASAHLKPAT